MASANFRAVVVPGMAGDERVAAFDSVDQFDRKQRIQRPVNRDWRHPLAGFALKPLEQIIGADGFVRIGDFFEHQPPKVSQPQATLFKGFLCANHGRINAGRMIMCVATFRRRYRHVPC